MSDYQAHARANDRYDPRNAPDYAGTECKSCGNTFESPGAEAEFENCHEHFFLSDRKIQEQTLEELLSEIVRLKAANLKLFREKEALESRVRYKEAALEESMALTQKYSDAIHEALASMWVARGMMRGKE